MLITYVSRIFCLIDDSPKSTQKEELVTIQVSLFSSFLESLWHVLLLTCSIIVQFSWRSARMQDSDCLSNKAHMFAHSLHINFEKGKVNLCTGISLINYDFVWP
ncbi:hypothetical protein HS088_TW18G00956 [Tripterygium wilfordii]|uniref:Uncharacterized protein n=1 Tax=Tripterygium wilfordii TaxID=458696 RepID=A0A7J7CDL7_TRIWF|nr:hypothetical protein HS088_TW18G00956 [Tripterygium wilfordii]